MRYDCSVYGNEYEAEYGNKYTPLEFLCLSNRESSEYYMEMLLEFDDIEIAKSISILIHEFMMYNQWCHLDKILIFLKNEL